MQTQLKHVYGRRTTPGVKILMLIAIIIFGLCAAFSNASEADARPTNTTIVK